MHLNIILRLSIVHAISNFFSFLLLWWSIMSWCMKSSSEQFKSKFLGHVVLGILVYWILALFWLKLLLYLFLQRLCIYLLVVFPVYSIELDILDSFLNILQQILLFYLFPSVSIVSNCAQGCLLLIISEFSILPQGVETNYVLDFSSLEWLSFNLLPLFLWMVFVIVFTFTLFFFQLIIVLSLFLILFSLSLHDINIIIDSNSQRVFIQAALVFKSNSHV